MRELAGVLAAVLSSALGGSAVAVTRFVVDATDPLTLGAFRFGIGVVLLLPIVMWTGGRWPKLADWPGIAGLGLLFFALFPVLFNAALAHTTAARGALALSTLPLLTMAVAAAFKVEPLTRRKSAGVLLAMAGVGIALSSGLRTAPPGARRGDLLMVGAAFCMALYSVWSRPFIARSGPLPFTSLAMLMGAAALVALAQARGGFAAVAGFGITRWSAILYLGMAGGALTFFVWAYALRHTTPTRVAVSMTVNPIAASLLGTVMLAEPITPDLLVGLLAVLIGISVAARQKTAGSNGSDSTKP